MSEELTGRLGALLARIDTRDADDLEVERLMALFDLPNKFEEAWRCSIEWDWQHEYWPSFKAMAVDIFEHGFRLALYCMVDPDGALPAQEAPDAPPDEVL